MRAPRAGVTRWLRYWGPAILWAGTIWIFSTDFFTSDSKWSFLGPLLKWLFPGESQPGLLQLHLFVRKAAHFVEYFILGLLVLRGIRGERTGWQFAWGLAALAIAASYAAIDEAHQRFVPGRGGSAQDVLLDSAGAAVAQAWAFWRGRKANLGLAGGSGKG
jgi:VanZ family protein